MTRQRTTLARPSRAIAGPALFTGADVTCTINPADAGSGLAFVIAGQTVPAIVHRLCPDPVHPAFAALPPRCTRLSDGSVSIATVEHALAALVGLGVTDARVVVEAPKPAHAELPILDGSAALFTDAILDAGLRSLDTTIEPISLRAPVRVGDSDTFVLAEPADTPSFTYHLDYGSGSGAIIQPATVSWDADPNAFTREIAPARTYSLEHEAHAMRNLGLFARFTPADLLVLGDTGPIDNALRFPDEPARHKLLDLVGDLALLGRPLLARVTASRSGHALHHEAARAILASI